METKEFIKTIHKTLDNFVENYKIAPNELRKFSTDKICYEFIMTITPYEAHQLGFKDYYDKRKVK